MESRNKSDTNLDESQSEKLIESWLNENHSWFEMYALENLDLNIVEKWLRLNNKNICKCNSLGESKSLSAFPRRKSCITSIINEATNEISNCFIKENQIYKPTRSETNKYVNNLVRSSSFDSLFYEEIEYKMNNDEQKVFDLEEDNNEQDDYKMKILERSVFSKPDSALNSQLLKLLKSKIKMPDMGKKMTVMEKLELKKRTCGNIFEMLIAIIKDTAKEVLPKEASEIIKANLKILVNCEYSSVLLLDKIHNKLYSYSHDQLFSKLNQSNEFLLHDLGTQIDANCSILGNVINKGITIVLNPEQVKSMRYDLVFEKQTDIKVQSILCMPIKNIDQEVIGLIQLVNKTENNGHFCSNDIKILKHYIEYCGILLVKSDMYYLCAYEYERCRCLLEVLHDLFLEQTDLEKIFFKIIEKAQMLLKCENCLILIQRDLPDNEKKSYDVYQIDLKPELKKHSILEKQVVISRDLVNYVLTTGQPVNLKDAYLDPIFDPNIDSVSISKTITKLLMPIKNLDGKPIGCVRAVNRIDNQPFDQNDEQLLEVFCLFCGLSISNTLMYKELEKNVAEKSVAFDVLSYHANYSKNEMEAFVEKLPSNENFFTVNPLIHIEYLSSYRFDDFALNYDEMVVASYEMFKRLGLIKSFKIDKKTLFQFLLTVRKNYRNVEYHNWSHAFNVCQNMFAIFMNSKISKYLQETEKIALLVGCLCHDLDHRGTNNLFQIESQSPLSQLYGTKAPMEKHHFNHCITILNSRGHNIFANVKPKIYQLLISLIKEAILATDLADHMECRKEFSNLVRSKNVDWREEINKSLLRKNLMTACDLASATKPWKIHKSIVNQVTNEFFAQGVRERTELNIEPTMIMDERQSDQLPLLQMGWIDGVCMPLFQNFALICESFEGHLNRMKENRLNWSLLNDKIKLSQLKENSKSLNSIGRA